MIVERLRALVILDEVGSDNPLGREAADEIERLRAENKWLRELLKYADDVVVWELVTTRSGFQEEIEAALDAPKRANP